MFTLLKRCVQNQLSKFDRRIAFSPVKKFLKDANIDCVLDVGANTGQYASGLRNLGYKGQIISFEPLPNEFKILTSNASHDSNWATNNFALGAKNELAQFSVAANSVSSSFLPVDQRVDVGLTDLTMVEKISVSVKTLDSVFTQCSAGFQNLYLKIDTQGFESQVISGASDSLPRIEFVQMEASLVPNYVGEMPIEEMISIMRSKNFEPWWFLEGYFNPRTFQLFQADIFFRQRR